MSLALVYLIISLPQGHVDGVNSTELIEDLIFLDQDEKIPNTGTLVSGFNNMKVKDQSVLTRVITSKIVPKH